MKAIEPAKGDPDGGTYCRITGSRFIADLPHAIAGLSTTNLMSVATASGRAYLHVMVIPAVLLCCAMAWMLHRTMFGRSIYAIGGDVEMMRRRRRERRARRDHRREALARRRSDGDELHDLGRERRDAFHRMRVRLAIDHH